ncbi:10921_t:CDS:2 [Ambispora leptoticha]|uniref:10921_t:CDS:1 n=1 Tax=Ambispora leptoticha TaxID=144679 RepID=A0A9N8Z9X0_9GLOM|nr:10921_t:CDS:2 [Ambispora leptoticha]
MAPKVTKGLNQTLYSQVNIPITEELLDDVLSSEELSQRLPFENFEFLIRIPKQQLSFRVKVAPRLYGLQLTFTPEFREIFIDLVLSSHNDESLNPLVNINDEGFKDTFPVSFPLSAAGIKDLVSSFRIFSRLLEGSWKIVVPAQKIEWDVKIVDRSGIIRITFKPKFKQPQALRDYVVIVHN